METFTTEMLLSVAVIVLTVLAIAVFIFNGAGGAFYGLFIVTVIVMVYTWYRISNSPSFKTETSPAARVQKRAKRSGKRRRR